MAATRSYRGVSADDRRGQRRITLMETALVCLLDDGLAGVSVRSVCARSKLTPRYFYEEFADLDELLVSAVDAVMDEVAQTAIDAVHAAAPDTAAQVRAAIETGLGIIEADPRKANVLLVAAVGHGPLRERRHTIVTDYADLVIGSLSVLNSLDRRSAEPRERRPCSWWAVRPTSSRRCWLVD